MRKTTTYSRQWSETTTICQWRFKDQSFSLLPIAVDGGENWFSRKQLAWLFFFFFLLLDARTVHGVKNDEDGVGVDF